MPRTVHAIDIGSTPLKAALVDEAGRILSAFQEASPLTVEKLDSEVVFRVAGEATRRGCADVQPDAIAITGATRTTVFADGNGAALSHAVKLDDGRGAQYQHDLRL